MRAIAASFALMICATASGSPLDRNTAGVLPLLGVTDAHPGVIMSNPATIGWLNRGWNLYIEGRGKLSTLKFSRKSIDENGNEFAEGSDRTATLAPSGTILAHWLDDNFFLAVGADIPVSEKWPSGSLTKYHTDGGYLQRIAPVSFAAGFRIGGRLSFAGRVSYKITRVSSSFAIDTALAGGSSGIAALCGGMPCGVENPLAAERHSIVARTERSLDLDNLTFSGGAILRTFKGVAHRSWFVGFSYQGEDFSKISTRGNATIQRAESLGGGTDTGEVEVTFGMPQEVNIGVRGPISQSLDITAQYRVRTLSQHGSLEYRYLDRDLPDRIIRHRGFDTVSGLTLGVQLTESTRYRYYQHGETLYFQQEKPFRFGVNLNWEQAAINKRSTSTQQVWPWSLGLASTAILNIGPKVKIEGSYSLTYFPSVTVTNSGYSPQETIECVDSEYDYEKCAVLRDGLNGPSAAGQYQHFGHDFRLGLRLSF